MASNHHERVNSQLQIKCSPRHYQQAVMKSNEPPYEDRDYWAHIPDYLIARCPLCLTPYIQAVDTHSLWLWDIRHNMNSVRYTARALQRCEHFVGVHSFLNLNGERPAANELANDFLFSSEPEIPIITATLLPSDVESYVILQELPICRIVEQEFVPTYSLYMLTYYAKDPAEVIARRLHEWTGGKVAKGKIWGYGYKRLGVYWEEAQDKPMAWDYAAWVRAGKMKWIDLRQSNLGLTDDMAQFPYVGITGLRHGYRYQQGKFTVVHTRPTIEEYKQSLE